MRTYRVFTATNQHGEIIDLLVDKDSFEGRVEYYLPNPDQLKDIQEKGEIDIEGDYEGCLPDVLRSE